MFNPRPVNARPAIQSGYPPLRSLSFIDESSLLDFVDADLAADTAPAVEARRDQPPGTKDERTSDRAP